MGNSQNRARKRKRRPPLKRAKKFKNGGLNAEDDQNPGPSNSKVKKRVASGVFRDNLCPAIKDLQTEITSCETRVF